jgi:hypothetical protein
VKKWVNGLFLFLLAFLTHATISVRTIAVKSGMDLTQCLIKRFIIRFIHTPAIGSGAVKINSAVVQKRMACKAVPAGRRAE